MDQHGARTLLAPWDGTRGSESGCDARRLSTGRSIRAWRTLCWRQMTRNAGALASETLVPWLDGPRSRGRSKRLLRSRRRVGGSRGGCAGRPLRWCKKEGNGRLKARRNRRGFCTPSAPSRDGTMRDTPFEHFGAMAQAVKRKSVRAGALLRCVALSVGRAFGGRWND